MALLLLSGLETVREVCMNTEYGILIAAVLFLAVVIIQFAWNQKKGRELFLKNAKQEFGRLPEREYTLEELERISHYFKNYKGQADFFLDDLTWNDLGMEDIFLLVNRTYSSVGEDYLYWLLRTPVSDPAVLQERHRVITFFQTHERERLKLQEVYHRLGRIRKHSVSDYLLRIKELETSGNGRHYAVLAAELFSLLLLFVDSGAGSLCLIASLCFGIMDYYRQKGNVEPYFVCLTQITGMLYDTEALTKSGIAGLDGYFDELRSIRRECRGMMRGAGLIASRRMTGSIQEALLDYVRIFTHVDLIQFNRMRRILSEKEKEIGRLIEIFGFLEAMIAAASFRELLEQSCVPEFDSASERAFLKIRELYHPQIGEPVANTICAEGGILITGSNASGKSTFLKTVGICSILAQTIMTVPAAEYRGCFFRLYSSMAVSDSLSRGESYYLAEIKAIQRIMEAGEQAERLGGFVLCLVDEVLRGTNTIERIAASAQVLRELSGDRSLCFAATHDIELTWMLERLYQNYHFEEEISDGDIQFDYRLRTGRAVTRNAIRLLALLGYPEEMIQAAEQTAEEFAEKGEWRCL